MLTTLKTPVKRYYERKRMLNDLTWLYSPILAGIALTYWVITFWGTGNLPPTFLTGLVATAWGWVFASREKEKADARKAL